MKPAERVAHHSTLDSTNAEACRAIATAQRAAFVVRADVQTAGRGQGARQWVSPAGGLWFSLAWPAQHPTAHYQGLPLMVGGAIAEALDAACGLEVQIKWPNDLFVANAKLGGILCAHRERDGEPWIVIGVGINGNYPASRIELPSGDRATTLAECCKRDVDLDRVLSACLDSLQASMTRFEVDGLADALPRLRHRLLGLNREIRFQPAPRTAPIRGHLLGVDRKGRLLLRTAAGDAAYADGRII